MSIDFSLRFPKIAVKTTFQLFTGRLTVTPLFLAWKNCCKRRKDAPKKDNREARTRMDEG